MTAAAFRAAAVGGLLLAACGPSVEEVIESNRSAVESRVAALRALESQIELPGEPAGAPDEPLIFFLEEAGFNACALQGGDFADLSSYRGAGLRAFPTAGRAWVPAVSRVVEGPRDRDSVPRAEDALRSFLKIRYALVLRQDEWVPGAVSGFAPLDPGRPGAGVGDRTFQPGRFRGEALLFELASGRLLLRLPIDVQHDAELGFLQGSDPQEAIREHLAGKIRVSVGRALAEAVPGSQGP